MPNRTIEILLKAGVDKSTATQGVRALQEIQRASEAAQASMLSLGGEPARVANQYKALGDVSKLIQRELDIQNIAQQYYTLGQIVGDDIGQLENLRRTMKEVGASSDEIDKATRAFQELQAQAQGAGKSTQGISGVEGLRRTGSALNQLGLNSIGEPLQNIGDVAQIIKELQTVSGALTKIGPAAETVVEPVDLAVQGVTGLSGALLPLGLALSAAGLLTAGIAEYQRKYNEQLKQGEDAIHAAVDRKAQFYTDKYTMTTEQATGAIEGEKTKKRIANDVVGDLQAEINRQSDLLAKKNSAFASLSPEQKTTNLRQRDEFKALFADLDKFTAQFDEADNRVNDLTRMIANNEFAINDAREATRKATEKVIASSVDLESQRKQEYSDTMLSSDAAKARLAELKNDQKAKEEERASLEKSGNTSKEVKAQIEGLDKALGDNANEQAFLLHTALPLITARENEAAAVKAAQEALNNYTSTMKQVGDAQKQITSIETERSKQLQKQSEDDAIQASRKATEEDYKDRIAEAKKNAALDKLTSDYFASELKALGEFHDQEAKSESKSAKDRLRLLEDASDDLFSAAANNDVVAFLNRQRQADKDLRRQKEDADDAEKDRIDAYLKEREQARAQYEEQYKIQEDAGNARNDRAAQLEQELNNIREQWRIDDINRQRDLEEQDFQQRMALAQARYSELLALADSYFQALKSSFENANPGTTLSMNSTGDLVFTEDGSGGTRPISRFAGGKDYVPYDKFPAYLDAGERVLTRQQNREYTSGRSGGSTTYQITIQNTVGDIATKSMLDNGIEDTLVGLRNVLRRRSNG